MPSLDSKRDTVREALSKLCQLPEKHEALGTRISLLESELKQQVDHLGEAPASSFAPIPGLGLSSRRNPGP